MRKLAVRMELKTTLRGKARYQAAAERRGLSLSDWVRRGLDALADEDLGQDDEPPEPTAEDIAETRRSLGVFRGTDFRERVLKARGPWTA